LTLTHPSGFGRIWGRYDPIDRWQHESQVVDGKLSIVKEAGARLPPEIYFLPKNGAPDLSALQMWIGGEKVSLESQNRGQVLCIKLEEVKLRVRLAWVPLPIETAAPMLDEGVRRQLRELGYVE
jgi:hypothetical protein